MNQTVLAVIPVYQYICDIYVCNSDRHHMNIYTYLACVGLICFLNLESKNEFYSLNLCSLYMYI